MVQEIGEAWRFLHLVLVLEVRIGRNNEDLYPVLAGEEELEAPS
jgi:hypothetical protein